MCVGRLLLIHGRSSSRNSSLLGFFFLLALSSVLLICLVVLLSTDSGLRDEDVLLWKTLRQESVVSRDRPSRNGSLHVGIVVVLDGSADANSAEASSSLKDYELAMSSMRCYANIHNYTLLFVDAKQYVNECPQKDFYMARHCVSSIVLNRFDWMLFIDADVGVVNPVRLIDEWLDPTSDLIFYDRFFNWEVAAGAYLARNTPYSRSFLRRFADYPQPSGAFSGTDNGVLHSYLVEELTPSAVSSPIWSVCRRLQATAHSYHELFRFQACARFCLGSATRFGPVKILRKGEGWMRDGWLTGSRWAPTRDFMLHGWQHRRQQQLPSHPIARLANWLRKMYYGESFAQWYSPFRGPLEDRHCRPRSSPSSSPHLWPYDDRLVSRHDQIQNDLLDIQKRVLRQQLASTAEIAQFL